ncbi:MAG: IS701 family transposase [Gemmatimonadales bacterium]
MTTNRLRAAARKLVGFHRRFAPLFGRKEARGHSLTYLRGLLLAKGRKCVERIALVFCLGTNNKAVSQKEVVAMQGFITTSPWEAGDVQQEIQAVFAEELVPSTSQWPIGTVGVIDESSFVKSGPESCGTKRQYCGRLGKKESCQVGVFLVGVTPAGCACLDQQLYLPEEWAKDKKRRKKTRVPKQIKFQTKPEIAEELVGRTIAAGHVRFDWLIADELYGRNQALLEGLDEMHQRYLMEVPCDTTVWTVDPATQIPPYSGSGRRPVNPRRDSVRQVQKLAAELSPSDWHTYTLREGSKGPLIFQFAWLRVWAMRNGKPGRPVWVMFRRSLAKNAEVKYYISNADEETPLEEMALVSGNRCRVEEYFQDGKMHLGMTDYEVRSWTSWHHHMTLVALAHLFVTLTKLDLQTETSELTLDMALDLLQSTLPCPTLTEEDSLHLLKYHLQRNHTAHRSHRKSWLRKHKNVKSKVLL